MLKMLKNLKIRTKLFVCFGIIIALFLTSVVASFSALSIANKDFTEFHDDAYHIASVTYEMRANMQRRAKNMCNAIIAPTAAETQHYIDLVKEEEAVLYEALAYLEEHSDDPELLSRATRVREILDLSKNTQIKLYNLALDVKIDEAIHLYFQSFEPALTEMQTLVLEMDAMTDEYATDIYNGSVSEIVRCSFVLAAIVVVALVITIIIAVRLSAMLVNPIQELKTAANEMSQGNLQAVDVLTYRSRDELGELSDALRTSMVTLDQYVAEISDTLSVMAQGDLTKNGNEITDFLGQFSSIKDSLLLILKSFNSTLTDIHFASAQVDAGSDQVASGAQALSQGATEQASSVQELAATVNDINNNVQQTGMDAAAASEKTSEAGVLMEQCDAQMKEMVSAMNEISSTSVEIGKIIKTIEDIAFQTNILALNAAVEAARAGAAGKGFAVVADEVRSLAAKSAEASKNSSALIQASMAAVENGARIAGRTADQLQKAAASSREVSVMVSHIADAAQTQAAAVEQVTTGIDQIASVVQTNSATAEQSAAASEELAGQAVILRERIQRFKLFEK